MPRSSVILLLPLLLLLFGVVFAAEPIGGLTDDAPLMPQLCNFDEDNRMYNATDLLLCMNEQARNILFQRSPANPNRITDRAYQDTRQSYPAYPFAPAYSPAGAAAPSNYFGNEMLSQLLSGGIQLPNFSNLLDFSSFTRPGFNLFNALSSIAQYDDLKCVPRILCEVASGSMPGSLSYRQSLGLENIGVNGLSGTNALFGLLSAFDTSGTSPILSFGRAALLGYTNRGQSQMCYREYSRCPRDSGQLISYLNNHNGGFFRFFNGNRGPYYPSYQPQQHYGYRPQNYYKNSDDRDSQYRILQKPQYPTSQIFSEADVEQGGPEGFQFSNPNYYHQQSNKPNNQITQFGNTNYYHLQGNKPEFFTMNVRESESSPVFFPKDKRDDRFSSNYLNRPINSYNDYQTYNFQKEAIRKDRKFFPTADDNYNRYPSTSNQIDDNRRPRFEQFENKVNIVRFPRDTVDEVESPQESLFFFSNNNRNRYRYE